MLIRKKNIVAAKADAYSDRIVKMARYLREEQKEYVLSSQILRSGTSIGANVAESIFAQSRADFTSKLYIALKEASETCFWLDKLLAGGYITQHQHDSMFTDNEEIIKLLTAITKTLKGK
jgi:four helix bundle protein